MKSTKTETELGRIVIESLAADGWDIYQEVTLGRGRADIVAVRGGIVWIIETKLTCSLSLLDQAFDRLRYAHYVSIAVPPANRPSIVAGIRHHYASTASARSALPRQIEAGLVPGLMLDRTSKPHVIRRSNEIS